MATEGRWAVCKADSYTLGGIVIMLYVLGLGYGGVADALFAPGLAGS